jgi:hypothetical protein
MNGIKKSFESTGQSTTRINCKVKGRAAQALFDLKNKGIVQSNREAVVQGLLALQEKITKSDIERIKLATFTERVFLRPWTEIVGTLKGIETTNTEIVALIGCISEKHAAIAVSKNSSESVKIQQSLKKLIGSKIAVIKTDNPEKPLAIRKVTGSSQANPIATVYEETTTSSNRIITKSIFNS